MPPIISLICYTLMATMIISLSKSLWNYTQLAKRSSLPYIISPVHVNNVAYWLLIGPAIALDRWVPMKNLQKWMPWTAILRVWQAGYQMFEVVNEDTFFMCSLSGNMVFTCDAHVIRQVLSRPHDFHAPIETLGLYNLYGPTLAASEGEQWRLYRKISTPFFNNETHQKVWRESLERVNHLSGHWSRSQTIISDVKGDLMSKLNLGVIAKIFYNQNLGYDNETAPIDISSRGHSLTFSEAINSVLSNLATLFATPKWLLARSPMKTHREIYLSYIEWQRYMQEMRDSVQSDIESVKQKGDPTFLESLVIASNIESKQTGGRSLTEPEVLGNMFFYVMAGFDTTSTTLSFVFLLLALHPSFQVLLQQQLDDVLGSKPVHEWNADHDFPKLLDGMVGAIINETLRLYHPVAWYARKTVHDITVIDSKGIERSIPAETTILFDMAALGRHPVYWPSNIDHSKSKNHSPALDFDPTRWLDGKAQANKETGAAFPFSSGHRACPGKRFAEIEMCAIVARVFKEFSLCLKPDDSDILEAKQKGHNEAWIVKRTRKRAADHMFDGLGFGHGIYPKHHVAFKIIPRSVTRFAV